MSNSPDSMPSPGNRLKALLGEHPGAARLLAVVAAVALAGAFGEQVVENVYHYDENGFVAGDEFSPTNPITWLAAPVSRAIETAQEHLGGSP